VLELLESDERMCFTLDGQLATVDDYLAIRPEAADRVRALVESGRLAIGPWQTLVDEFLVGGETICRNLEAGLARAAELGGAMLVGYLPDSFGHVAQMPQILRSAGIDTAVVWRGVPAAIGSHRFAWSSPDGSTVTAEYLPAGYGNAAYLFDTDPPGLPAFEQEMTPWFGRDPILAMVGTDHMPPLDGLPDRVPADARIGTVSGYLDLETRGSVDAWTGELRSGARANLLPGVVSARIDIKQACARAERALERYAEPLRALYGGDEQAGRFLDEAWSRVLQNAAHDSICGCSADEVSAQVLVRYAEAEQIGRGLTQRVVDRIAADAPAGSFVVVNPSPFPRTDLVELDVAVPDAWEAVALELPDGSRVPAQEVRRREPVLWERRVDASQVHEQLRRRIHGRELFGLVLNGIRLEGDALTLEVDDVADPESLDVGGLLRDIASLASSGTWTLRIEARARRVVVANVPVPPLGHATVRPVRGTAAPRARPEPLPTIRIVRGRDVGDSYNYAPPADDVLVDIPDHEERLTIESGPVRTVALDRRTYRWDGELVRVDIVVELRVGEAFVRVRIELDNPCDDQRVRVHVPLDEPAWTSRAEGQFAVVERPRTPEGGHGEVPVGTYPASAFVCAGRIALLLEHVTEYELLHDELALTVLRSTGLISRSDNPYRDDPAGPEVPIPAAQLRGRHSFSFAWLPDDGDVVRQAERFRLPFVAAPGRGPDGPLREHAGPELDGAVLSSLRRRDGGVDARVVNETPAAAAVRFGDAAFELDPWEIRTLRLRA
jgi:glycosyl hydrolase family 38/alpha mannosidase-like protein